MIRFRRTHCRWTSAFDSRLFAAWLLASNVACGTASPAPSPPAPPSQDAPAPPTISVTSAGVSPLDLTIEIGSRVRFMNQDDRPHTFAGGPDPLRPECPEIDRAGFLAPGQSRDTGVFEVARTCRYHDHAQIGVLAFEGRITVR